MHIEVVRYAYVEAMVFDRVIPGFDGKINGLEVTFFKLPRRTMNEVVATTAKLSKTCSQPAALFLKGFKHREVAQSDLETSDTLAQR